MKIKIKVHNSTTNGWDKLSAYSLLGKSIVEYMIATEERIVAAVYSDDEEEQPNLFISNSEKDQDFYKQHGVSLSVQEISKLMETQGSVPKVVLEVFPDAEFIEARSL